MKKLILLGALSVLLYSAPGYTMHQGQKKTVPTGQQALELRQAAALLREKAEECQAVKARVETQAGKFRAANDIVKQLNAQLEGTAAKLIDAAVQLSVQLPADADTQLDKMKEELEQLNVKFADAKKARDFLRTQTEGTAAEMVNAYEEFKKMNKDFQRVQAAAEEAAQATTNKEQLSTSEEKTASLKAVVAAEIEAATKKTWQERAAEEAAAEKAAAEKAAAEKAAQATTNKEQLSTSEEKTASLKAVVAAEIEAATKKTWKERAAEEAAAEKAAATQRAAAEEAAAEKAAAVQRATQRATQRAAAELAAELATFEARIAEVETSPECVARLVKVVPTQVEKCKAANALVEKLKAQVVKEKEACSFLHTRKEDANQECLAANAQLRQLEAQLEDAQNRGDEEDTKRLFNQARCVRITRDLYDSARSNNWECDRADDQLMQLNDQLGAAQVHAMQLNVQLGAAQVYADWKQAQKAPAEDPAD